MGKSLFVQIINGFLTFVDVLHFRNLDVEKPILKKVNLLHLLLFHKIQLLRKSHLKFRILLLMPGKQ